MNNDVKKRLSGLSRSSIVGADILEALAEISRLQSLADSNATYGIKAEERIAALEASNQLLRKIAERLEVLAVKWVDAGHHDWPEIKELSKALEQK